MINLICVALDSAANRRVIKVQYGFDTRLGSLIVHILDSGSAFDTRGKR